MSFNIFDFLKSLITLTVFDYLREVWSGSMSPGTIELILT